MQPGQVLEAPPTKPGLTPASFYVDRAERPEIYLLINIVQNSAFRKRKSGKEIDFVICDKTLCKQCYVTFCRDRRAAGPAQNILWSAPAAAPTFGADGRLQNVISRPAARSGRVRLFEKLW